MEWFGCGRSPDGSDIMWVLLCFGWCSLYELVYCFIVGHFCSCLWTGQGDGCYATSKDCYHFGRKIEQVLSFKICTLLSSRMFTTGLFFFFLSVRLEDFFVISSYLYICFGSIEKPQEESIVFNHCINDFSLCYTSRIIFLRKNLFLNILGSLYS